MPSTMPITSIDVPKIQTWANVIARNAPSEYFPTMAASTKDISCVPRLMAMIGTANRHRALSSVRATDMGGASPCRRRAETKRGWTEGAGFCPAGRAASTSARNR